MLPSRKRNRLDGYDYSSGGAVFITICTKDKRCLLSDIVVGKGLAPPETRLTPVGRIVDEQIRSIQERYPSITVDKYVVMLNHIHLLLSLGRTREGQAPPLQGKTKFLHFYRRMA